ncbi:MAG: hypothetical protein LBS34_03265, partial [Rickettsiales bacterium]|nr:hypothetical protein [Rickettsiales bacterium]
PFDPVPVIEEYWKDVEGGFNGNWKKQKAHMTWKDQISWFDQLQQTVEGKKEDLYKRLKILVEQVYVVIQETKIPILKMPEKDFATAENNLWSNPDEHPDIVESIFIRVNSQGTVLAGEELTYSIFKSIFPENKDLVESVGKNSHVRPSRLVTLVGRLLLTDREKTDVMPGALNISSFRKNINDLKHIVPGKTKKQILKEFISCGEAERLFQTVSNLLVGRDDDKPENKTVEKGLGRILTADIAQHQTDLYFLLLNDVYNQKISKDDLENPAVRKRILGVITAVAWFSFDPSEFARRLWKTDVKWWLPTTNLMTNQLLSLKARGNLVMYPLPSPLVLERTINFLTKPNEPDELKWTKWWEWPNESKKNISGNIDNNWPLEKGEDQYVQKEELFQLFGLSYTDDPDKVDSNQIDLDLKPWLDRIWQKFWSTVIYDTKLVLFAQRKYLANWFPGYEPEAQDQQEDSSRPYDWDHILPQSYFGAHSKASSIWKYLGETIGNLRALPLSQNRSEGNIAPAEKLEDEENQRMSAIHLQVEPKSWIDIGKKFEEIKPYLRYDTVVEKDDDGFVKIDDKGYKCRLNVRNSIGNRIVALYQHWYETFDVGQYLSSDSGK